MSDMKKNQALEAEIKYKTAVETATDYIENFDILETITNVGNDEVFTPRHTCDMMLDSLPDEVWHNPNYKWLNPATKNGIFEREIAIRLDKGLENIIPDVETRRKHILQNMIFAIGQTKFTSNVARRTLYYCSEANRKCDGIKADDGHYVNGYAIGNGSWFDTAEGNILTPCTDHKFIFNKCIMPTDCKEEEKKKYKCPYCGLSGDTLYSDKNQLETYAYEFIHIAKEKLLEHLQDRFFGGNRAMKFDVIIGNPPYQLNDGGGTGTSAIPIYNKFINQAISLNPKYISMIIPSKWFSGGKGLDDFRKMMLTNKHISYLVDYENFRDVFPSVDLVGGACYFLWQKDRFFDKTYVYNKTKTTSNVSLRKLNEYEFFIRSNSAVDFVKKINKDVKKHISDIVSPRLPFNIPTTYKPIDKGIPCHFTQKLGIQYVDPKDCKDDYNYLNKYKLLIPKAPIAGQTDFSKPIMIYYEGNIKIANPGEICSESWLVAYASEDFNQVLGFKKYLLTKTFRYLLLQTLISQNTSRKNFCFIPDLIDYHIDISDDYLKEIWNITKEEWDIINYKIRNQGE